MKIWQFLRGALLFVATLVLVAPAAEAQGVKYNILTGGPTGTYIQFGRDIADAAANCGVELNVNESAGSLENFLGVRTRRHTQFGIVQSDVLEYLKTFAADDPDVARAVLGVRIAFPLYNEEVHILARRDIADFSGLSGKKVSIGVQDSGTFLTASLMLDLSGVEPAERQTLNAEASLAALMAGEVDAFFYVAGAPTKLFQNGEIDASRFHLLPIADRTLQSVYVPAQIPAGTYPFQSSAVDVVAVKAVLMTYEFNPRRNNYHRASCKAVSDIAHVVTQSFGALQENGHPKWKQVDLNDLPPGWDVGACVNEGLNPNYGLSCKPVSGAVSSGTDSAANTAYRKQICAAVGC